MTDTRLHRDDFKTDACGRLSLAWLKLMTFPMISWWCSFLLLWQILTSPSLI